MTVTSAAAPALDTSVPSPLGLVLGPVVVTGANGFIGRHLCAALTARDVPVVGMDVRAPGTDPAAVKPDSPGRPVAQVRLDLATADPVEFAEHLAEAEAVVHLASATDVGASWEAGFADQAASVLATQRVLRACRIANVPRVVVASSSHVYGPSCDGPVDEDALAEPTSPYGVAKLATERLALAYARRPGSGLSAVALRFFTAFGPGCRPSMVVNRFFTAAITGQPVPLYGAGTAPHNWTYVSDLVEATLAAITMPLDAGRGVVVNAAGHASASLRQVAEQIGHLVGEVVPLRQEAERAGDAAATRADLTRAAQVLRWAPAIGLEQGLRLQWQHLRRSRKPVTAGEAQQ